MRSATRALIPQPLLPPTGEGEPARRSAIALGRFVNRPYVKTSSDARLPSPETGEGPGMGASRAEPRAGNAHPSALLLVIAVLLCIGTAVGCGGYRPARFADKPAVTEVGDDAPVPVPRRRRLHEPVWLADVYVRRPLVNALEAERIPEAGDVNALDEVPRSSWFDPPRTVNAAAMRKRPGSPGPPRPPLLVLAGSPSAGRAGVRVLDSRGFVYELRVDPPDRPAMRTAAEAIASRLAYGIGFRTPEVFVTSLGPDDFQVGSEANRADGSTVDVAAFLASGPPADAKGRYRVSATHWPVGLEIGPAPISGIRDDDPNDLVPHRDRRTLRSLKVVAAFLKLSRIGPHSIADVYVGPEGEGHVRHYLVGLDDALGASDIVRESDPRPEVAPLPPFESLVTLGLAPSPKRPPTQTEFPSIGDLPEDLDPARFEPPDPYEPMDRLLPSDGYWAAKRIATLSRTAIWAAIREARIDDAPTRARLAEILLARRRAILEHYYGQVSPLEVVSDARGDIVIGDKAILDGIADAKQTRYSLVFLDEEGREVAKRQRWKASGKTFRLPLTDETRAVPYLVVRIVVIRDGKASPRAFEVHLVQEGGKPRVVGVRH